MKFLIGMKLRMTNKHFGSSLEDWLESENLLEEATTIANERIKN